MKPVGSERQLLDSQCISDGGCKSRRVRRGMVLDGKLCIPVVIAGKSLPDATLFLTGLLGGGPLQAFSHEFKHCCWSRFEWVFKPGALARFAEFTVKQLAQY